MNKIFALGLIFLFDLVSACPVPEDIAPCVCSEDSLGRFSIQCYGIDSESQLETIFQADFPSKTYLNFYLDESPQITSIGRVFNGVSFEVVEMYRSGIQTFAEDTLADSLSTLQRLIVKSLPISVFPFEVFQNYAGLTVLTIMDTDVPYIGSLSSNSIQTLSVVSSRLTDISEGTFQGMSSLTAVNFERNNITRLQLGTFSNLPQIHSINLSENDLDTIETGTFEFNDFTTSLYLWNNKITALEPGSFVLPSTLDSFSIFLDIGSNNLQELNQDALAPLFPYMDFLFAAGNPLTCGCDIAWLVINQEWMGKVGNTAECIDGTRLVDLDPNTYQDNC